ncbi:MAG: divalent-cation tolerance protein CutA [Verrucomicrobia bacterium]|nr:divalent-cation tolerance protein CutA [Verrucomicrobiota bacterium]
MKSEEQVLVVLCTFPSVEKARQIGTALVERQLVACVNLVPKMESIYRWEGRICEETEVLGLFKTTAGRLGALREAIEELHPYDVPEVVALVVVGGSERYLEWVRGE